MHRVLGGGFAISACVGGIIGLGILRTPGEIAAVFPDPVIYVGLWLGGGVFVLISTSVVAELVGLTPRSGGAYVLIRQAFGPYPGFLMGWTDWLSFAATLALKATVLVEYVTLLLPGAAAWRLPAAIAVTTIFALLQLSGVRLAAGVQRAAAAGMAMTVVGFSLALLVANVPTPAAGTTTAGVSGPAAYGLVAAAIIFTYDGWIAASYFGGEIKGGGGATARACVKSVAIILLLYVALNAALALSVPLASLAGHDLALAGALELAFGPAAATIVTVAAVLILLAHQNLNYMQSSRILYALSTDGLGLRRAAALGRRGNPVFAVLATWLLAVGLIVSGGFDFLLKLTVLFFVVLYVALLAGVLILRGSRPGVERPYRAWGHPWSTWACMFGWLAVSVFMAITSPQSAIGAGVLLAGSLPVWFGVKRYRAVRAETIG